MYAKISTIFYKILHFKVAFITDSVMLIVSIYIWENVISRSLNSKGQWYMSLSEEQVEHIFFSFEMDYFVLYQWSMEWDALLNWFFKEVTKLSGDNDSTKYTYISRTSFDKLKINK